MIFSLTTGDPFSPDSAKFKIDKFFQNYKLDKIANL